MATRVDTVVIGAGDAGLAVGRMLVAHLCADDARTVRAAHSEMEEAG